MKIVKKMLIGVCLGMMMMAAGCGSDENIPGTVQTQTVAAVNAAGTTATLSQAVALVPVNSTVEVLKIAANDVITVTDASAAKLTAAPVIVATTPAVADVVGTTFALASTGGMIDISIPNVKSFTLATGATVTIPVTDVTGLVDGDTAVPVTSVKADGTVIDYVGKYSASAKTVTVTNVKNFCKFIIHPKWKNKKDNTTTGSLGGNKFN